jgi:hypothetical protein
VGDDLGVWDTDYNSLVEIGTAQDLLPAAVLCPSGGALSLNIELVTNPKMASPEVMNLELGSARRQKR